MSTYYPRRRITITACVLLGLGFALLRLPLDQKSYAKESANMLRGSSSSSSSSRNSRGSRNNRGGNRRPRTGTTAKGRVSKGGMVRLENVKAEVVNHRDSKATKQVLIINGQVPHVTGFSRAVFGPDHEVEEHYHKSMDEVFYVEHGKGIFEIDGTVVQVSDGTTLHVAAGQRHRIKNTGKEEMVMIYLGIAVDPAPPRGEDSDTNGSSSPHGILFCIVGVLAVVAVAEEWRRRSGASNTNNTNSP